MTVAAERSPYRSPWLVIFGIVAAGQLLLIALQIPGQIGAIPTWLVAPALAVWVWRARGPKLLVAALLLCWVGDLLGNPRLLGLPPAAFYLSIASFVLAIAVLVILFVRGGAMRSVPGGRRLLRAGIGVVYLAAGAAALVISWNGLGGVLRVVGIAYVLLLVIMATTAFMLHRQIGLGAALLLAAHLLIVLEVGGPVDGTTTVFRLVFWTLYLLGILLIAMGVVSGQRRLRAD